jgi:hypothetical protein
MEVCSYDKDKLQFSIGSIQQVSGANFTTGVPPTSINVGVEIRSPLPLLAFVLGGGSLVVASCSMFGEQN